MIFSTAEFCGKSAKLSKLGKKLHKKMEATDQLRYNGFHVIRDRVITAFQCTSSVDGFYSWDTRRIGKWPIARYHAHCVHSVASSCKFS